MPNEPQELSEDELFDNATSEAPAEEAVAEPAGESVEQSGQPRDEAGRFAAATPEAEPETVAATDPPAKAPVDDNAAMVPSWRVREINEEKRALADRVAAFEAERLQWQQRQQQAAPRVEPAKAEKPDPLLDPEGYAKAVRDEIRNEIINERREESLVRAREANQQEFDEAYAAAQRGVDPALRARMLASRDPGKTLLEWHRENKTRQEIGGDLNAYKQRIRDEALKDAEFRKAAMAAWQSEAQPTVNGRPRVDLPPSLNGASRSNAALRSAMNADVDDDALFEQTTG